MRGWSEVSLYGCDGSYGDTTHADENQHQPNQMLVRCAGTLFRTNPQMILQSEALASIGTAAPSFLRDCSGGLLGALIASGGDWELVEWDSAPDNVRALMNAGKR